MTLKQITKVAEVPAEEVPRGVATAKAFDLDAWQPKTALGMKVKRREITDINTILESGERILESEIVDALLPHLESDILAVGQSKGKFGGGKRSIWRQTQKKTKEGNKPSFATLIVVGDHDGYVGIGFGKAKETVPAREKALRQAKLNLIRIRRGCGSWQCGCKTPHSFPFLAEGKSGSVRIVLKSAPKGSGLVVEKECQKILTFAGIKDTYSKIYGQSRTKLNVMYACFDALKELSTVKVLPTMKHHLGLREGSIHEI